jgi:hypothetical protein
MMSTSTRFVPLLPAATASLLVEQLEPYPVIIREKRPKRQGQHVDSLRQSDGCIMILQRLLCSVTHI